MTKYDKLCQLQFDQHTLEAQSALQAFREVLTALFPVKKCPLCGSTSQDGCAENDCDNDWTDFWIPEDPTPWCTGCGAMTQAKCKCGPIRACDDGPYAD